MTTMITVPDAHRQAFPGLPESIGQARAWVLSCLPAGCPRADDVALVVSELATNAVLHSASGAAGGRYAVQVELDVQSCGQACRVGVTCIDLGPAPAPKPRPAGEGGYGLALVNEVADTYEVRIEPTSRTVCCWLGWRPADDNRTSSHGPGAVTCRKDV